MGTSLQDLQARSIDCNREKTNDYLHLGMLSLVGDAEFGMRRVFIYFLFPKTKIICY